MRASRVLCDITKGQKCLHAKETFFFEHLKSPQISLLENVSAKSISTLKTKKQQPFLCPWCYGLFVCVLDFLKCPPQSDEAAFMLWLFIIQAKEELSVPPTTLVCCLRYCFALIVMPLNVPCDIIDSFSWTLAFLTQSKKKKQQQKKPLLYQAPSCRSILQISF